VIDHLLLPLLIDRKQSICWDAATNWSVKLCVLLCQCNTNINTCECARAREEQLDATVHSHSIVSQGRGEERIFHIEINIDVMMRIEVNDPLHC